MTSVLLAEDEFLIRAVVVDALGGIDIACIEAPTGHKAIEVINSETPLSAIIVDIGLPDMSGERVIEAAVERRPDTPIIRCSGAGVTEASSNPKIHVVSKPFSAVDLARLVESLIKSG